MEKKTSYTDAINELEELVIEIETGDISVDELSKKVKRAARLIKICKNKLTTTEEEVNKIFEEINSKET